MKITLNREDIVNQYPPFNVTNTKEVVDLFAKEQIHLYVHLPFCKKSVTTATTNHSIHFRMK